MVHIDDQKKYVTLDNVRAFYRAKDDSIHLTSTDPDVQAGGFHLSLNKGTQTENTIREILIDAGVIHTFPRISPNEELISKLTQQVSPSAEGTIVNSTSSKGASGKTTAALTAASALTAGMNLSLVDADDLGKIITVVSPKGGVGKTTVAVSLAASILNSPLAKESPGRDALKVLVVDLDLRDGQISNYTEAKTPNVLNAYVESGTNKVSTEAILKSIHYDAELKVSFLLAPVRSRTADILHPKFFASAFQTLRTMFDVIIVDTAVSDVYGRNEPLLREVALPASDIVLAVTSISSSMLVSTEAWLENTTEDVRRKTKVVLNQVMQDTNVLDIQNGLNSVSDTAMILTAIPIDSKKATSLRTFKDIVLALKERSEYSAAYASLSKVLLRTLFNRK